MRRTALVLALAASGCRTEESDRWRYERVLFEEDPSIRARGDAGERSRRLEEKSELTLEDCWHLAVERSEMLALDGEELARIQARYEQAVGTLFPSVAFRGTYSRQDDTGVIQSGSVQQSFTLRERTDYRFTAHQPLFNGLREVYTLRQGNALYGAREHALRHSRGLLRIDAADSFYGVLQLDRELATIGDTLRLAEERLEELVQRNRAGISRRSEVLSQEAEVASTRAVLERLRGAHAVAWEALRFLTGIGGARRLVDTLQAPGELPALHAYVDRAHALRDDLRALRRQVLAAEEGIGIARAGYFPTAALDANYYTHREGISSEIDWDVALSFDIPLFEGAVTQAKLREARSIVRSSNLQLERRRREIELEVSRAYEAVKTLHAEQASLEKAVASAQEGHDLVQAEYRQGIATNVEVLTAFNTLQQARLARDRAGFQARVALVRLEVQSGHIPGGDR